MKKILYKSNYSEKAAGILLAVFEFEWKDYETKRVGLFRKKVAKNVRTEKCYLVFTPYKHRMKEIEIIKNEDVLSEPQFDDSLHIVEASRYISSTPYNHYLEEECECTIINFKGCDFILNNKSLISNVYYTYQNPALEVLYKNIPNIIDEVFDDEQ